jgi:chromosome segregation ATPase
MRRQTRRRLTQNVSRFYLVLGVFFVVGFLFFGTSSFFFAEEAPVNETPINEAIRLSNGETVTLHASSYDTEAKTIRIRLSLDEAPGNTNDHLFRYVYKARPDSEKEVMVLYERNDQYVLELKDVPRDFDQLAVRIYGVDESQSIDTLTSEERENSLLTSLYADRRTIEQANHSSSDETTFTRLFVGDEFAETERQLEKAQQSVEAQRQQIKRLDRDKEELEGELPYLSLDEQVEQENEIFDLGRKRDELTLELEKLEQSVIALEEKHDKLRVRLRELSI